MSITCPSVRTVSARSSMLIEEKSFERERKKASTGPVILAPDIRMEGLVDILVGMGGGLVD